ncbi:MAG: Fe-S cluster assembly ATPase SufC [Candidatus Hydrogenedentes bacterium]|nr:Fe-S cluster assembly ATPase SufC [Candidatus Hydrogenedentota bacterium]
MLEISNLHVSVDGHEILKGVNLIVDAGEVHAIMGPNGSGKSTLALALAGHGAYEVTEGSVTFLGHDDFLDMPPEERARLGLFLAFQYPVEIPGISNAYFLQSALNEMRKSHGMEELDAFEFQDLLAEKMELVKVDPSFADRNVNEGFSGGEKKRNEILQMAVMEPRLAILDETDSGLDIDALRIVAEGINRLRGKDRAFVLVTHYQRMLNYVKPDFVHVLYQGKFAKSGGPELALELEDKGYDWLKESVPA